MALKYHHRTVTDIPFIDQIDIDLINASTVRVNIKEKEIAASIFHNGRNVYISGEGIIQTISGRKAENTTQITGLTLTDTAMGEQIRAENQQGMNLSLELLNALNKYGIHADSIDVDDNNSLTVSFGNVRVRAGKGGYDQKMFKLHQIVPYLEGRSGIISMTGYNYNGENIVLYPFIRPEVTRAEAAVEAVKANGDEKVEQVKPVVKEEEEPASGTKKTDTKKQKMKQENKPEEVSGKKTSEKTTSEKTAPKKEISEKAVQEKAAPKKEASEKTAQEKTAPKKEASEKTVQEKAASKKEEPAKDTSEKKSGEADSEKEKQTNKEDAVKKNTAEKTEKIAETAEKTAETAEKTSENGSKMKENASKEDTTKKKVSED
jgi:DNA polymerase III gamma/tau subunit